MVYHQQSRQSRVPTVRGSLSANPDTGSPEEGPLSQHPVIVDVISRCRCIDGGSTHTPSCKGDPPPPALSEAYHPALHRARIESDHSNVIPQRRYPLLGPSHSLAPSTENVSSRTWKHCSLR